MKTTFHFDDPMSCTSHGEEKINGCDSSTNIEQEQQNHEILQTLAVENKSCIFTRSHYQNNKKHLLIATWNIRSWNLREQEIISELERQHIDICAISETKKKGKGKIEYENYIFIYSGVDEPVRAKAGVGILINKELETNIEEIKHISERILRIAIKLSNSKLYIFSVYGPVDCKLKNVKKQFYDILQQELSSVNDKNPIIILGDINARIGNDVIPGVKQQFNEGTCNNSGDIFTQFCVNNNLRINNTFFDHNMQYKYTWQNTRGQKSVIDYIVTNTHIHPSRILDVRTLNSCAIGCDHSLLLGKICIF